MDLYDELPKSRLLYDSDFEALLESTAQNKVTIVDFLTLTTPELAKLTQRSINEVGKFQQILLKEFEQQYCGNTVKCISEYVGNEQFTTGDVSIDDVLGGGIATGGITEIFGESSTGKSQLLMQICLSIQLPRSEGGLSAKCVYITTEGDLPTSRIAGILETRKEWQTFGVSQRNIFTVSCPDLVAQEHIMNIQLPVLLDRNKDIRLIIIDSISHHLRVELQAKSFKESQENKAYIAAMGTTLKDMANKYQLSVVVANQVSDKPLGEIIDPTPLAINDLDYQLGWMVGWKNSTIRYRQAIHQTAAKQLPSKVNIENILSDDEDYMLIEDQIRQIKQEEDDNKFVEVPSEVSTKERPESSGSSQSLTGLKPQKQIRFRKPVKRKLDYRVPNLGLVWANCVSTRILLKKSYKASPLIKRGELKNLKENGVSDFWQVKRVLKVVFSSFCDSDEINFKITKFGIETV